jgi:phytoene desaturase
MKDCLVIGAGLGGLSAAIRLAHAGYNVTILEKNEEAGGKLRPITLGPYQFDLGPSTITLKHVFDMVFQSVGRKPEDYLDFYPIDSGTRNFFSPDVHLDFSRDEAAVKKQIAEFSRHDADNYEAFLEEAKRLYDISHRQFFSQLMYPLTTQLSPSLIKDFIKIKPFKTLASLLDDYFEHPYTKKMFLRYATYVGSSPYQSPMIFAMMAHLEGSQGIWGVRGGTYAIVDAFVRLGEELGVVIKYNQNVTKIRKKHDRVIGVEVGDIFYDSDVIIVNADALTAYQTFMSHHPLSYALRKKDVSLSGFVWLVGINQTYDVLKHHNVFFPVDYTQEFEAIFDDLDVPETPTIYICQSSVSEPERATPGGGNLFILINAPHLSDKFVWNEIAIREMKRRIIKQLEHFGLAQLEERIEEEFFYTPKDLMDRTAAYKGAIYGMSSNSVSQAFFKVENRDPIYRNLYFTGGATHPGGGTPMVTLSGQLVAADIMKRLR